MNGQLKELYEMLHPGEEYKSVTITTGSTSEQEDGLREALKGDGLSRNEPDSAFDREQLTNGTLVETEHTSDLGAAKEIAKDHLKEDESYYEKGDFPKEVEEAKERVLSDANCKDCYNKKLRDAIIGQRSGRIIKELGELFGGANDNNREHY